MIYEAIMLSILIMELLMEAFHLYFDIGRDWSDKYLWNYKLVLKVVLMSVLAVDFCYFYWNYKEDALRVGRYMRPRMGDVINW